MARPVGTGKKVRIGYKRVKYTDTQKVAALCLLESNKGDVPTTARELGIPYVTLRSWAKGERGSYLHSLYRAKRGDMLEAMRDALWIFLGVAVGKAEAANFNHLITGIGTVFDRMRILEGLPTTNTVNTNVNVDLTRLSPEERRAFAELLRKTGYDPGSPLPLPSGTGPPVAAGIPDPVVPRVGADPDGPV